MLGQLYACYDGLSPFQRSYFRLFGILDVGWRVRALHLFRALKKYRFQSIADVGCGGGLCTLSVAQRYPHAKVVGIDCNRQQLAVAQQIKERAKVKNCEFLEEDVCNELPLSLRNQFDAIFSLDVLEEIPSDEKALQGMWSLLKPGGVALVHIPNREVRHFLKAFGERVGESVYHVREGYSPAEMEEKLKRAGFAIIQTRYTLGKVAQAVRELMYPELGVLKSKVLRAILFPFFLLLLQLERFPRRSGNGLFVVARKELK